MNKYDCREPLGMGFCYLNSQTRKCYEARDGNKLIGWSFIYRNSSKEDLLAVFVLPEYRGKNIGTRLVKKLIRNKLNQPYFKPFAYTEEYLERIINKLEVDIEL